MATAPYPSPYHRYRIGERDLRFRIPRCPANWLALLPDQTVGQQRHHRKHPQQYRRCSLYRYIIPLSLRLDSQVRSRFFKGHFHPPAPHKPLQDLLRFMLAIRTHQSLRLELALRVSNQHPANRYSFKAAFVPQCRFAIDFKFALATAIPVSNLDLLPEGFGVVESGFRILSSRSFDSWSSKLARRARRRVVPEFSIHPQPSDHTHLRLVTDEGEQVEHGKTAIGNKDQCPARQEAGQELNHLPGTLGQLLMASTAFLIVSLRRRQCRKHRQCPNAVCPRDLDQQHSAKPAQATGFYKMRMTRTDRIAVDAFSTDHLAAPPLNGVIDADDEFAVGSKGRNQQAQQNSRGGYRRPASAGEEAMIVLKVKIIRFATDAQASCDGTFTDSQNRADNQEFGVLKDWFGEQWRKGYNEIHKFGRQGKHTNSFLGGKTCSLLSLPSLFQRSKLDKVELSLQRSPCKD